MPRFSIKDLMLAITLVAAGMGMACYAIRPGAEVETFRPMLQLQVGIALIGAGIFAPFTRPWKGAIITVVAINVFAAALGSLAMR